MNLTHMACKTRNRIRMKIRHSHREIYTVKKSTLSVRAGSRREKNMGGLNTPLISSSAIEYLDDSEVRYQRYFNTLNHDVVAG